MSTDDYRDDESRPLPELHPDIQATTLARQDLEVQRIRWELTQMGLATSTSGDTVSVETTADVDGHVVTVTNAQQVSPGQNPATVRAAVRARANDEAFQEALEQVQVEQVQRTEDSPRRRPPQV